MANKENKAKGRIVKAVDKVLSKPRTEGPAQRKRVTIYTSEAAKAAGERYRTTVQEGMATGDSNFSKKQLNPHSAKGSEESVGKALLAGNPFASQSRASKEGEKQKARNARVGTAKPHGQKRITQTGTPVGNKAKVPVQGSREYVEARGDDKGNVEIPGGRNNPIFDPKNVDKFYNKGEGVGEVNNYVASHQNKLTPRPSEKDSKKPASRPATVLKAPAGKRIAENFTGKGPRIVEAKSNKTGGGVPWLHQEQTAAEKAAEV